jgi:hypothetical protein
MPEEVPMDSAVAAAGTQQTVVLARDAPAVGIEGTAAGIGEPVAGIEGTVAGIEEPVAGIEEPVAEIEGPAAGIEGEGEIEGTADGTAGIAAEARPKTDQIEPIAVAAG